MKKEFLVGLATGLFMFGMVGLANATLLFEIERISDNTASITASGTFDSALGASNNHILMFDDLFSFTSIGNPNLGDASGISYDSGGNYDYFYGLGPNRESTYGGDLYMFSEVPGTGWEISGSAIIDASATDWILNDAGYTGNVYSGMPGGELVGSFTFATDPVPEPATMLLLGTGLIGLAGARRKMKS